MKYSYYFILVFSLTLSTITHSKRIACWPKSFLVKDLVAKIIELKKTAPYPGINHDLATMYMIGSIHESFVICEPFGPKRSLKWGEFVPTPQEKIDKIIFWDDGEVKNKEYLLKAKELLTCDDSNEKTSHEYDRFKLAWLYEKLGNTEKAIALYEETYKEKSKKVQTALFCRMMQCWELMATVESLQHLHNIYEKKSDTKKMLELKKMIQEYEKLRVFSQADS